MADLRKKQIRLPVAGAVAPQEGWDVLRVGGFWSHQLHEFSWSGYQEMDLMIFFICQHFSHHTAPSKVHDLRTSEESLHWLH